MLERLTKKRWMVRFPSCEGRWGVLYKQLNTPPQPHSQPHPLSRGEFALMLFVSSHNLHPWQLNTRIFYILQYSFLHS